MSISTFTKNNSSFPWMEKNGELVAWLEKVFRGRNIPWRYMKNSTWLEIGDSWCYKPLFLPLWTHLPSGWSMRGFPWHICEACIHQSRWICWSLSCNSHSHSVLGENFVPTTMKVQKAENPKVTASPSSSWSQYAWDFSSHCTPFIRVL